VKNDAMITISQQFSGSSKIDPKDCSKYDVIYLFFYFFLQSEVLLEVSFVFVAN